MATELRERILNQDLSHSDAATAERVFVFCELTAQAAVKDGLIVPKPLWGPVVVKLSNAMVEPSAPVQLVNSVDARVDQKETPAGVVLPAFVAMDKDDDIEADYGIDALHDIETEYGIEWHSVKLDGDTDSDLLNSDPAVAHLREHSL